MFASPLPLYPAAPIAPPLSPVAPIDFPIPELPPLSSPLDAYNPLFGLGKILDNLFGTPAADAPNLPKDFGDRRGITPPMATPSSLGKIPFKGGQRGGKTYEVRIDWYRTDFGTVSRVATNYAYALGPIGGASFVVYEQFGNYKGFSGRLKSGNSQGYVQFEATGGSVSGDTQFIITNVIVSAPNDSETDGDPPAVGGNNYGRGNGVTPPSRYGIGTGTAPSPTKPKNPPKLPPGVIPWPPKPKTPDKAPDRKPPITPKPDEKPDERIKPFKKPKPDPPKKPDDLPKLPPLKPPEEPPIKQPKPQIPDKTTPKKDPPFIPPELDPPPPKTDPKTPRKPEERPEVPNPNKDPNSNPRPRVPPSREETEEERKKREEQEKNGFPRTLPPFYPPTSPSGGNGNQTGNGGQNNNNGGFNPGVITPPPSNPNNGGGNNPPPVLPPNNPPPSNDDGSGGRLEQIKQKLTDIERKIGNPTQNTTNNNTTNVTNNNITNVTSEGISCSELKDCLSTNTETANIKKFVSCDTQTNEPIFETVQITVNKGDKAHVEAMAEALANLEGEQCNKSNAIALVPEWWQQRSGQIPQLVVRFQVVNDDGTIGQSAWSLTIPHYIRGENFSPKFPVYKKGDIQGILVLSDNSKLTINCSTVTEAKRVINAIKQYIDPNFLKGSSSKITERFGASFSNATVKAVSAKFFPDGQKNTTAAWSIKLR